MESVELVIPYPGVVYDMDKISADSEAFIPNGSDDGQPFRMITNHSKQFRFSSDELNEFDFDDF